MKFIKTKNQDDFFQMFETFKGYLVYFFNENLKGFFKWLWELELMVFTKKWKLPNIGNDVSDDVGSDASDDVEIDANNNVKGVI
jgi:hypothetical protein